MNPRTLVVGYTTLCIMTSIALAVIKPPPLNEPPEETRRTQRVRIRRPIQRFTRRQMHK
jgi:hypothetical protein